MLPQVRDQMNGLRYKLTEVQWLLSASLALRSDHMTVCCWVVISDCLQESKQPIPDLMTTVQVKSEGSDRESSHSLSNLMELTEVEMAPPR